MQPDHRPPASPDRTLVDRALAALEQFVHVEAASGVVLLFAAALGLVWVNSAFAESYLRLWHVQVSVGPAGMAFSQTLHFWINDVVMTAFFLVVGMEIRREIQQGSLSNLRQASLPIIAALGGVMVPALIYLTLNHEAPRQNGWAIPTATDIAFAVGVLALVGRAVPVDARVFLLALAIIDDIVAILIVAIFYAGSLVPGGFFVAALGAGVVLVFQRLEIGSAYAYVLPGAIVWFGLFRAGIHPTLAGVVLGMMTPVFPVGRNAEPPVTRVQNALHPWVAFGVMPLFALANAGVSLRGIDLSSVGPLLVASGVAFALLLGKPLGVIGATWLTVRSGLGRLPPGMSWGWMVLIGLLAGIGFTMSIFIAMLAFFDETLLAAAKIGVIAGSAAAGFIGVAFGKLLARWDGSTRG